MTGPDHYREAERLLVQAAAWRDADTGWKAGLTAMERLAYQSTDTAAAQVHATLAAAAATALNDADPNGDGMPRVDYRAWHGVAGTQG